MVILIKHNDLIKEEEQSQRSSTMVGTDTFTYQEQITIQKYKKILESGNENIAMGFSRFVTSNEWEEYIKNPFSSGAREQYLQHVLVL